MKPILSVPMPRWAGRQLLYMWCTGCTWRFPIDCLDYPDERTIDAVKHAFNAHDCAASNAS